MPGDEDQLAQVMTNLIENAVKYGPATSTVTVRLHRDQHHPMLRESAVVLEVSDEGEGIDPVHLPRLTERFYRIDDHRSREVGGTGLGLVIASELVKGHGGSLSLSRTDQTGTEFVLRLPKHPLEIGQAAE